jgi:predicted PurR-regulated permease PerM
MATKAAEEHTPETVPERVELHVPVVTIVKILLAALLVWSLLRLLPELVLFVFAVLAAVTLAPAVRWLEGRRLSRAVAVSIVGICILALVCAFFALVVPPLTSQLSTLAGNYRAYRARAEQRLSPEYPFFKQVTLQVLDLPSSPEVASSLKRPLAWGQAAAVGLTGSVLLLVLVLYLLFDGKRVYAWLLAYVPRKHRRRIAQTIPEMSEIVVAYVQGQLFTSLLYGLFAFIVLSVLKVPAALPLALIAAICDVIPVLGVIVSTVPAAFLALTVSPLAAALVIVLYLLYHLLENYVIVPRVYGRGLQLSSLAVLVTLIVGGALAGIVGAILALPVVAAYPLLERIWLQNYLSDDVLTDHSALEAAVESGRSDQAVEKVLRGEKHGAAQAK